MPRQRDFRLPPSRFFPPATLADEDGIVAVGGDARPEMLLDAYTHGIFAWPPDSRSPLYWASPPWRAIFTWSSIHIPRRLRPLIKRGEFTITVDREFLAVVQACATVDREETWITPQLMEGFVELHHLGFAHSLEVWRAGKLAGGLFGVAIRGFFSAESMFHLASNASKVGVLFLLAHLKKRGYSLIDIQMLTPVTQALGAQVISRREYLRRLALSLDVEACFGETLAATPEDVLGLEQTPGP